MLVSFAMMCSVSAYSKFSKFERIVKFGKITCGLSLSDRFCATRSLFLEGGRPQNGGYPMYPQRLMVLQKYVCSSRHWRRDP